MEDIVYLDECPLSRKNGTYGGAAGNKEGIVYKDEFRTIKNYANKELAELLEESFSETESKHLVNLEELLLHLKHNPILKQVKGIAERFWEQAVVDIYINNNDRNNGNWGILRDTEGVDFLAPVFDNGGCLQTKISEIKIASILANEHEAIKNACNTQTAYGGGGHALSAGRFLDLYETYESLRKAILKVVPLIRSREQKIYDMIYNIPEKYTLKNGKVIDVCSYNRKELYLLQMRSRLENLLEVYCEKAKI